jgi:hypothetical protein
MSEPHHIRRAANRVAPATCARLLLLSGCLGGLAVAASTTELVAPYVPTVSEDVELMLELGAVGPGDYVIDLGAGDGRIVITAALRGALGLGVELDRELVALARERARAAEVDDQAAFVEGDIFLADLGHASVVTLYLMPEVNLRLRPKLLHELAPGTRVISNSFDMGDWEPDRYEVGRSSGGIFLWVVPADVQGEWRISVPAGTRLPVRHFDLKINQQYQQIEVSARAGAEALHVFQSVLRGDRISFIVADAARRYAFSGRIDGDSIRGSVLIHEGGGSLQGTWQAGRSRTAASRP